MRSPSTESRGGCGKAVAPIHQSPLEAAAYGRGQEGLISSWRSRIRGLAIGMPSSFDVRIKKRNATGDEAIADDDRPGCTMSARDLIGRVPDRPSN
jgi:hypothetical protein